MDTLKLNKWKVIIISFFLALFFINRECKKNEEEMLRQNIIAAKNCYNDTIIKPHDEGVTGKDKPNFKNNKRQRDVY